jgi:hypothetical protein
MFFFFFLFTNFNLDIVLKAHNGYRLLIDMIRKKELTLECSNRVLVVIWYAHILKKIAFDFLIVRVTSHSCSDVQSAFCLEGLDLN